MIALTKLEDACAACKIIISYLIKRRTAVRTKSGVLGKLGAAVGTELCCSGHRGGVVLVVVLYVLPPFSSKSVCILRGLFEFVSTVSAE